MSIKEVKRMDVIHQGSLDTCQDILKVIKGVKVVTLAEVQAGIKKQEEGEQEYLR